MDQKTIDFWDKSVSRMFWLGIAIVAGITVNTAVRHFYSPKDDDSQTSKSKKEIDTDPESADEASPKKRHKATKKVAFADEEKGSQGIKALKSPNLGVIPDSQVSKRKSSVDNFSSLHNRPTNVYTIVFTGGPCAGKTTAITYCAEKIRELGFSAICVPEAATMIFSSGGVLNMTTYTPYQGIEFQKALMKLQMSLEDIFMKIVSINNKQETCFVLCDRGLMDGSAYLSKEQWEVLLNECGIYEQDIKEDRYDLVIHLTTAADGAEDHYQCQNNVARDENIAVAIDVDRKIRAAWSNHPNYFLINNEVANFETKIRTAYGYIMQTQGFPSETSFSIKFLMRNIDNAFERIVKRYKLEVFNVTDTFLDKKISDELASPVPQGVQNHDRVVYIRRRVVHLHAGAQQQAHLHQGRPLLQEGRVELLHQAQHHVEGVQLIPRDVQEQQPQRDLLAHDGAHPRHVAAPHSGTCRWSCSPTRPTPSSSSLSRAARPSRPSPRASRWPF